MLSSDTRLNGRRYRLLDWEGLRVRVYDDAKTALKLQELYNDDEADLNVRFDVSMHLLFCDPEAVVSHVKDIGGLLVQALKDVAGFTDRESAEQPVMDWDADAQYIRASVQMTYGRSLDELAADTDFETLCYLVSLCPHETPIGQALYYRTAKPPKPTKHNQAEREDFRKKQKFWALKPSKTRTSARGKQRDRFETMNKENMSAFKALSHAARR